jgi:hypothetical protein
MLKFSSLATGNFRRFALPTDGSTFPEKTLFRITWSAHTVNCDIDLELLQFQEPITNNRHTMAPRAYSKTYKVPRRPFEAARLYVLSHPLC